MIQVKDEHAWGWKDFSQKEFNQRYGWGVIHEWGELIDSLPSGLTHRDDISQYDDALKYEKDLLENRMRRDGFSPFLHPVEIRRKRLCVVGNADCECGERIILAVYCYAAKIGTKLAELYPYIHDEDELQRLLILSQELSGELKKT